MPKVLIIYDTVTGNNRLMAERVEEGVKSVKGVEVELHKIGSKFPISILGDADAIVVGSPSIYGNMSPELNRFFSNLKYLKEENRINLEGKKGAARARWHAERIERELMALGLEMVAPTLSIVERTGKFKIKIHPDDQQKCQNLGRTIAKALIERV